MLALANTPKETYTIAMPQYELEVSTYQSNKARLLADGLAGQFILLKGSDIIGIYSDADRAYKAGLEKFGNVPMFIKQITKDEPTQSSPALFFGVVNARF